MIRITVELVPWGLESRARVIAQGTIANDGTGTPTTGSYRYEITKQGSSGVWKRGRVGGFKRKRDNVWRLLGLVLEDAL